MTDGDDSEPTGSFKPVNPGCASGSARLTLDDDQVRYHLVVDEATGVRSVHLCNAHPSVAPSPHVTGEVADSLFPRREASRERRGDNGV